MKSLIEGSEDRPVAQCNEGRWGGVVALAVLSVIDPATGISVLV